MHRELQKLTSREVERILRSYGFALDRTAGSHQQFVGFVRERKRTVTVIKNQIRFAPKTLASMIRQSGLTEQEWLNASKQ
jgi:predicted RNA binding protein YcfA (HicA-like mRNA interferase family)